MLTRFVKLLVALAIIGFLLYIVSVNRATVTFRLYDSFELKEYTLGVMAIIIFAAGILTASITSMFFAVPAYIKHRALRARLKNADNFYAKVVEARNATASRQWARARSLWEQLLKKDPTDAVAAIELSKVLEHLGEARLALKELTAAKAKAPTNIELLFRCAEVNLSLNNKTGALDNLAQVLSLETSRHALELAMHLSEENNAFNDALEHLERLESLGNVPTEISQRIRLSQLLQSIQDAPQEEQKSQLRKFIRKYPRSSAALKHLAKLELSKEANGLAESCKLLMQAFKINPGLTTINSLIEICEEYNNPQEAKKVLVQASQSEHISPSAILLLAKHFLITNDEEHARACLKRARELLSVTSNTIQILDSEGALIDSSTESSNIYSSSIYSGSIYSGSIYSSNYWEKELLMLESLADLKVGNADSAKENLLSAI